MSTSAYFANPERLRRLALRETDEWSLATWWRRKYDNRDQRPLGERTQAGLLLEHYRDLALEMVQLRSRFEAGVDDDEDGKLAARLTDLEDVFLDKKSDGPSGDPWIDSQLAMMESEVKEFTFDERPRDES